MAEGILAQEMVEVPVDKLPVEAVVVGNEHGLAVVDGTNPAALADCCITAFGSSNCNVSSRVKPLINFQDKLGVAVVDASVGGYDQRTSPSGIIAVVPRESVLGFQNSNHFLPVKLSGG